MRTRKGFIAMIGITLVLQACGSGGVAPTTESIAAAQDAPTITEIPAAESTSPEASADEFFSSIPFRSGLGFRGPWLELYFIDPTSPLAQRNIGSVDAFVSAAIVAANQSVDVALRTLTLDTITKAIIGASSRGIPVRVVAETDNMNSRSKFQALINSGIPVVDDQQKGLMNDSFIVIDHNQVWTGSADYDNSGMYRRYNTVVRINSDEIAADYTKEFDEMFVNHQFGQLVVPETPYPSVTIQGTQVEVLFSPDDFVVSRLGQVLGEAQESIYFLAYAFASTDLGTIIREKAAQGIKVAGVLEADRVDPSRVDANPDLRGELNLFQQAGIDVRLDGGSELMNHKIIIIDGKIVVMGSYDFTDRAENENDENVLIFYNEDIAQKFMEEFERVQSRAQ